MPSYCCIRSCGNNSIYNSELKFYEFPKVWKRTLKLKKLSELRIKRWFKAINRKSLNAKSRVCSTHFRSGKCAKLTDCFSPDWVPSLHLDHSKSGKSRKAKASSITATKTSSHSTSSENEDIMETEEEFLEDYLDEVKQESADYDSVDKTKCEDVAINCCVPNCKNVRYKKQSTVKFFRFPSIEQNFNDTICGNERQSAWINAVKRIDITPLNAACKIICSDHFRTGAPANANDTSHPDWIPTQKLPTILTQPVKKNPSFKIIDKSDQWDSLDASDPLAEEEIQLQISHSERNSLPSMNIENEIQKLKLENEMLKKQLIAKDSTITNLDKEILTLIECHNSELNEKDKIIQMLETTNLRMSLSRDGFIKDDKKVNYFTGLPNFAVLDIVYNFVKEELVCCLKRRINKFDAFILVLLKLRLDLPMTYIGYRYGIAGNTASSIFQTNLKMLSEKIAPFIRWPEKEALRKNTSMYFKRVLGNKFTAFIDFIEDPGPAVSQEHFTQKNYRKHKYLVAISPAGAIIFVSKGYDSSLSVKEISEKCGVLDYTDDGDIILCDHGKTTHQVFSYNGSKVLLPSTNNEDNDLLDSLLHNPVQLSHDNTPEVGSCRVNIQQSLSNLKNKFFVLTNKHKIGLNKSEKCNEGEHYFDYVVKVCCALINVSPTILSLETKKS